MTSEQFAAALATCVPADSIQRQVPLAPLTTFRIGGPADWLITVSSVEQLRAVLLIARDAAVPVSVLGGGSNVVIADEGVRGVVLRLNLHGISQPAERVVRAEGGVTMNGLVRWTIGRGLAGLEAWAGTPGTVGGAVYGNAHFSGRNIGDLVKSVLLVAPSAELVSASRHGMEFAYDTSRLKRTGEILVWADFAATHGDPDQLRERARESLAYRKRTQPLAMPSAGCIFQNPEPGRDQVPEGIPWSAGALVDRAGLKGLRIGGASISASHANFIVNHGAATAADVRALVARARDAVRDQFGVELRDEVVYLGHF